MEVVDKEKILTRYAPSPVEHVEDFLQLHEFISAHCVGALAKVPADWKGACG